MLKSLMTRTFKSALMVGVAIAGATSFGVAYAQPADEPAASGPVEKVTVTGSRIKRSTFNADRPVTVLEGEEVRKSGFANLGEMLRQDLAIGSGGFNQTSNLNSSGSTSVDLRNLGTNRTLVLVNGKRVATFSDSLQNEVTDLSGIPIAMISRVEVLRDGASSTYGTDAIAGVVNIILRDDFEGIELSGGTGVSTFGDAEQMFLSGVVGGNFDRGNVVISGEYRWLDDVTQKDRPWAIPTISGIGGGANPTATGSGVGPGGDVFSALSGGRVWCTRPKALGGDEVSNGVGTAVVCPAEATPSASQVNRYDYALQQFILGELKNLNLSGFGSYELGDGVEFFGGFQYSMRESHSRLDGNPIGFGSVFPYHHPDDPFGGAGWFVPATNPYVAAALPLETDGVFLQIRPTSTVGARDQAIDSALVRADFGFRGEELFGTSLSWEASYLTTQLNNEDRTNYTVNIRHAITITDPALCAADTICSQALLDSGKVPGVDALDPLRPGNWSAAEINYIRQSSQVTSEYKTDTIYANVTGELFDLWAGPVAFAAGYEYRQESGDFKPDPITEAGDSVANAIKSAFTKFDTTEFYGELDIPLVKDQPLFSELTLNLQGRLFEYSNFGNDSVYKVGLVYAPVQDLRFRANYGTSFRAPTVGDLVGSTVSFDFINDPCNALVGTEDPALIANCAAAGMPVGTANTTIQHSVLAGGDLLDGVANLGPETGESFTVGAAFNPDWFPGFQASVDYYNITVSDFITREDPQDLIDACYNEGDAASCARFTRFTIAQAPGVVASNFIGLTSGAINGEGRFETAGVDYALRYRTDLGLFGLPTYGIQFDHLGNYVSDYNIAPGLGRVDTNNGSQPRYRGVFATEVSQSDWSMRWTMRYVDEMDDTSQARFVGCLPTGNFKCYTGPEYELEHDLRVTYDATEQFLFVGGVNNVFDEEPPYAFNTGDNTDSLTYSSAVVGRYFYLRGTFKM